MSIRTRLVLVALILATAVALPTPGHAQESPAEAPISAGQDRDGQILLFSVPGLTWAHVAEYDLPAIDRFLDGAAVANLAPRGVRVRAAPGAAYLTIGSGSRAIGLNALDGQLFGVDDMISGTAAGEMFSRRTGVEPMGDHVVIGWPDLLQRNAAEPYDAELGALANSLADAGLAARAVGNADGTDTLEDSHERQVGLSVATGDGEIPSGRFEVNLLVSDETTTARPFGRRLHTDRFVEAFEELWTMPDTGLVVAEASDLARAMRYRDRVDVERYGELWEESLLEADALFGRLLEQVDPAVDSVLLVAPYNLPGDRDLTVAALASATDLRGEGAGSGYLRSASTQRSGHVQLVDIAPTVLELLDISRPTSMEGRPFDVSSSSASIERRVDRLVSANDASRFRENLLVPTTLVIVVTLGVVTALAIGALAATSAPAWFRTAVRTGALFALLIFPLSFVARAFPLEELGLGFYWAFLLFTAAVAAAGLTVIGNRIHRPRLALLVGLVVVVAVPVLDVTNGSRLSMSAAFGYSPTGNARLYGISNYALGAFGAAISLLAGFVASRAPTRPYRAMAIAMMVAALVIIGVPIWGANVGGILSFSPVVVLFAALVIRYRLRLWRMILGFGVVTTASLAAFASLDLARSSGQRAHLGRLVERISDEGFGVVIGFIERKGQAAWQVSLSSFWSAAVVVAVVFFVYLFRLPSAPLAGLRERIPHLSAGLIAAVAAAAFGSVANDSGTIVAGTAMLVVVASLVWLTMEPAAEPTSVAGEP